MSEIRLVSTRTFRVWLYTVSHSMLLLRSLRGPQFATRVDLLFKPVCRMSIPTLLDGVDLRAVGRNELPTKLAAEVGDCKPTSTFYSLSGESLTSWVVSGTASWHEDEGADNEPSHFSVPRVVWDI